jgi:hypothetical protein|uniref:ID639 n=1 Tax=Bradyrhizobium japonicum TaxID=375 RepID=Q9AN14_BRAJP|nr:ID639 [Bradyrhizobium japonicum]
MRGASLIVMESLVQQPNRRRSQTDGKGGRRDDLICSPSTHMRPLQLADHLVRFGGSVSASSTDRHVSTSSSLGNG